MTFYLQARNVEDNSWLTGQELSNEQWERELILNRWRTIMAMKEFANVEVRVIKVEVRP
jgi:hypothetical protein